MYCFFILKLGSIILLRIKLNTLLAINTKLYYYFTIGKSTEGDLYPFPSASSAE